MRSPSATAIDPLLRDRRRLMLGIGALPLLSSAAARAAVGGLPGNTGHNDPSPQWEALRGKLFGSRPIDTGSDRVQLSAPLRAAYGASVPVKIVSQLPQGPDLYVK